MSNFKRMCAIALSLMMILCVVSTTAFAAETDDYAIMEELNTTTDTIGVMPYAASVPTTLGSLPYTATVTNLDEQHCTYTKYYFAPSGTSLKISYNLQSAGDKNDTARSAIIYLYEVNNSNAVDSCTISQFLGSTSSEHTFSNLDTNKHYYFMIKNTTGRALFVDKYISGTVTITNG